MEPQLTSSGEIKVIGLEVRTSNARESDPKTARIPGLWHRFFAEQVAEQIPNRTDSNTLLAVYTKYESDHTGEYSLIVGGAVSSLEQIAEGMAGVTIPGAKYLVFPVHGPMPQAVIEVWNSIWHYFSIPSPYRRAYTADLEVYEQSPQGGNPAAKIYVAIA